MPEDDAWKIISKRCAMHGSGLVVMLEPTGKPRAMNAEAWAFRDGRTLEKLQPLLMEASLVFEMNVRESAR